jgi:hypothetical protein
MLGGGAVQRSRRRCGSIPRLAVLSSFALTPSIAPADDASVTEELVSGTVLPTATTTVQMVSEEVTYRNDQVRTDFVLKNVTAKPVTVSVGFPVVGDPARLGVDLMGTAPSPSVSEEEKRRRIDGSYRFASLLDGQPLSRKLVPVKRASPGAVPEYDYMYVANVSFGPHQLRSLQNFYYQRGEKSRDSIGWSHWSTRYLVHTGASWFGPIEKGVFRFFVRRLRARPRLTSWTIPTDRLDAQSRPMCYWSERYSVEPPDYKTEDHGEDIALLWRLANFEPDFDIKISWDGGCEGEVVLPGYDTLRDIAEERPSTASGRDVCASFDETFLKADAWRYARALAEDDGWRREPLAPSVARFAVNLIYALHGHRFKDETWQRAFGCFPWYKPTIDSPALKPDFQALVDQLQKSYRADPQPQP